MKIASRPQTSLRLVSKAFSVENKGGIDTLQIFFDTDIREVNFVNLICFEVRETSG